MTERGQSFVGGNKGARGVPISKRDPGLNSASLTRGERVSPMVDNQKERTDLISRHGSRTLANRTLMMFRREWVRLNEL